MPTARAVTGRNDCKRLPAPLLAWQSDVSLKGAAGAGTERSETRPAMARKPFFRRETGKRPEPAESFKYVRRSFA